MSLATVKFGEVDAEKFAKLQEAFTTEFHGGNHTDNSGTIIDHGSTVDYKYDSEKQALTLSVEKINRFHFRKPDSDEVINGLKAYVEEVLGELPPDYQEPEEDQTEIVSETGESEITQVEGSEPASEVNSGNIAGISPTTENSPATKENHQTGEPETNQTEQSSVSEERPTPQFTPKMKPTISSNEPTNANSPDSGTVIN